MLAPRPRINLILYHGVLAPRGQRVEDQASAEAPETARGHTRNRLRADLMSRTFGFDVLACPRSGGRLRLIAIIEQAAVIERILRHLELPTEIPAPRPARAPPHAARDFDLALAGPADEAQMFDPCS